MRGSKAKRLRRERPDRPNPGRVSGGAHGLDRTALRREAARNQLLETIKAQAAKVKKPKAEAADA